MGAGIRSRELLGVHFGNGRWFYKYKDVRRHWNFTYSLHNSKLVGGGVPSVSCIRNTATPNQTRNPRANTTYSPQTGNEVSFGEYILYFIRMQET